MKTQRKRRMPPLSESQKEKLSFALLKDKTGQSFGKLTVNGLAGRRPVIWNCTCICGKKLPVLSIALPYRYSCGCLTAERTREKLRKRPFEALYNDLCRKAKTREIVVELAYEQFLVYTEIDKCHYCDATLKWPDLSRATWKQHRATNLDRKDSDGCYSLENCVACCSRCNKAKGDSFTYEEWLKIGACIRRMRKGGRPCLTILIPDQPLVATIS